MRKRAEVPFEFVGCIELRQILGLRAETERQLARYVKEVPLDSVYYHTHGSLLRHRYRAGVYANDFATWAAIQVRDRVLGEQLAVLDPYDFQGLADLRDEIVLVINNHLNSMTVVPRVVYGEPFDFIASRVVAVPTGVKSYSLAEFRQGVSEVDARSIYSHVLEARVRLGRRQNDFSAWLRDCLDLPGLATKIQSLNPFIGGLERVRTELLAHCDLVLTQGRDL